ncbi:alpha/beta hydrolase [Gordonia sp. zg691]|uniref:Alpha/beta hydrolase n=1 Tax=Gordonia jinghuaiqii TaxID=2758710 RepID=A0A7D7QWE8_9ACTN|nr:alpha/beta hydrolase [Gordonia jinghuaiqii]MBD0863504.1 alpha/beta hydrolase [Gordonia jinghuaiqii]MCR5979239.1 alpha/beta hydrolase [Gordonia jinghuaiqii]QMT01029.1 alpha/beta hydrolase [Gordonia jinghuaiqii]
MPTDHAPSRELPALAALGRKELAKAVTGLADVHASVADTVFTGLRFAWGPRVRPAQMIHDAISTSTYSAIVSSVDVVGDLAESMAFLHGGVPSETKRGAVAIGILDGLIGDQLTAENSPLAPETAVRVDGAIVPITPGDLATAFPRATGHLTVFLHGLMETEFAWERGGRPTYGARLADDLGSTEVMIRYNSGRHISDNGRDLAQLLTDLVSWWPVPVTDLTLIGHSMGGLVIRSACHSAVADDAHWPKLVRQTVCLGTPHLGAPLARGVHRATSALRLWKTSRPFGTLLGRRSAGVRDLFHGAVAEDHWRDTDPDAFRQPAVDYPPLMEGARHLYVTATVTRRPDHPFGRIVGDGLVLTNSGGGRDRKRHLGFEVDDGLHIGGAHHFTLLNDDAVYEWMLPLLGPRRALPRGTV